MRTAAAIGGFLLAALPAGANPNILDLAGQCHWQSKQKACNKLADLAEHDRDAAVRILAVKQLDDQAVLARVAQADTDEAVRSAAVSTLSAIAFGRDLTVEDQGLLAQIAETDGGGSYQALARLKDQALLAQVAAKTRSYYARLLATEKLSDEVLNQVDQDSQETTDFREAMRADTVESLSGFIKRHPDGIRVGRALAAIWQALLSEFPSASFNTGETYPELTYPNEQGSYLFAAIETNQPFVIAFAPAEVAVAASSPSGSGPVSVTVEFRELAGEPVKIDELAPFLTMLDGEQYSFRTTSEDQIPPVSVPPYGRASYTWNGRLSAETLEFTSHVSRTNTLHTSTRLTVR
jgi:hypothetical protein